MEPLSASSALARVRDLAHAPQESTLLLAGESGIGKSHLLEQAQAAASITAVLVRVNATEAAFPLSGISAVLAALRAECRVDFGGRFELRSYEPRAMFTAAHDLLSLLQGFALPPMLLLIDDIDLMDAESQVLLSVMASRLAGTHVRIVATAATIRPDSPLRDVPVLRLAALSIAELMAIARRHTTDGDEATLRILVAYAEGNPRVLEEHLRLTEPEQLRGTAWLTLPPRWNRALEAVTAPQLEQLTPDDLELLEIVALSPLAHSRVLNERGVETADRVQDLVDAGLLSRHGPYLSFRDRRLRSYFYWLRDTRVRRERHAEMAEAVAGHDADLAAWHRSFAAEGDRGIDDLLAAAISKLGQGETLATLEYAERALRLCLRAEDHLPLVIELSTRLLLHGHVAFSARYGAHIRPESVGSEHAMRLAISGLSAQMLSSQHLVDDEVRALAGLHAGSDPETTVQLLTAAALFRAERWEVDEARSLLATIDGLRSQVSESTLAHFHTAHDIFDALDGRLPADDSLPPELHLVDLEQRPPTLLLMQARLLTKREFYDDARHLLNVVLNHPDHVDPLWTSLARYALIANEITAGQSRRARIAFDSWDNGGPWIRRNSSTHSLLLGWYAYSVGRTDEAAELLDRCIEQSTVEGALANRANALALHGTMSLLLDDPERAVVQLRQVSGFAGRFRNPTLLRHWSDYIEACALTQRTREAEGVLSTLEKRLKVHHGRWGSLALAHGRAILAPDETAVGLFATALDLVDGSPYARGRVLLSLAHRQELLGLSHDSRRTRTAALAAFDAAGALSWAEHCERPSSDDDNPSVMDLLSDEEKVIVRQVQEGMHNREIAASLFLSVRTVELRLTHIYRTLGVPSRSHLVAALNQVPGGRRPA